MMRQKEIDLLYQYLWNRFTYLEQDVQQLQQNVRYRHIDAVDCLELCLEQDVQQLQQIGRAHV